MTLTLRTTRWAIFIGMMLTVPVIFFLLQLAALMPLAAIVVIGVAHIASERGFLILALIHTAVYAPIFWLLAHFLSRAVMSIASPPVRLAALGAILFLLFVVTLVAPYSIGGHSNDQSLSWAQTFRER